MLEEISCEKDKCCIYVLHFVMNTSEYLNMMLNYQTNGNVMFKRWMLPDGTEISLTYVPVIGPSIYYIDSQYLQTQ